MQINIQFCVECKATCWVVKLNVFLLQIISGRHIVGVIRFVNI